MFYAVKAVNDIEYNKIYDTWDECKDVVLGKKCVYRSFPTYEEAELYLINTPVGEKAAFQKFIPADVNDTSIIGKFARTLYCDKSNGYCCHVYETVKGERVTCRGYHLPDSKKVLYYFTGQFVVDEKYGYEFDVETYREYIPDSKAGIVGFLSSGLFKGLGVKKAEAIYRRFKDDTLNIIENEPKLLSNINGISLRLALSIGSQYQECKKITEVTSFLLEYGMPVKYAAKIYEKYGKSSVDTMTKHPYWISELRGLTFEDADRLAKQLHFPLNHAERISSAIYTVLKRNEVCGDTGMEWAAYGIAVHELLGSNAVTQDEIVNCTIAMVNQSKLTIRRIEFKGEVRRYVFTMDSYEREDRIAKNIMRINSDESVLCIKNAEEKLNQLEKARNIKLDITQRKAVLSGVCGEPFLVITGGPGTGKTSIITMIADLYSQENENIIFLAPTGRAARRISETTKREAFTLHSFLKLFFDSDRAESDVEIEDALLVVDEFSMADVYISDVLFQAVKKGCRVILLGDSDQLPSVGPGAVLRDIINAGAVKVIRLTKIFRQDNDERIRENANKINKGDTNILPGKDFNIYDTDSLEDIRNIMADLYVKRTAEYGLGNVMCLCPYKDHTAGVKDMNELLQEVLNPYVDTEIKAHGEKFRPGDIVMHLKNTDSASNGDIGIIKDIDEDAEIIYVNMNDRLQEYASDDFHMLTLAYATTIHKSQGSEADCVIYGFTEFHKAMLYRNLPYVATSRGKRMVDYVGSMNALRIAIQNVKKNERLTLIGRLLAYYAGEYVKV